MSVKLYCNACEKFLKEMDEKETRSITGKELCKSCEERINQAFKGIDNAQKKYQSEIDALYNEVKKEYNKFASLHLQKKSQVNIILSNVRPEIEKLVQEIFKNRKTRRSST